MSKLNEKKKPSDPHKGEKTTVASSVFPGPSCPPPRMRAVSFVT